MEIKICGWENHNPRKDLKTMTWFRVESGIGFSEKLFRLPADGKWLWIFLLSLCARNNTGKSKFQLDFIEFHTGIKEKQLIKYFKILEQSQLIEIIQDVPNTDESDRCRIVPDTNTDENGPYERTNKRTNETDITDTQKRNNNSSKPEFDFVGLYKKYPRQEGRTPGLKKCEKQITSSKKFKDLELAIDNYANLERAKETKKQYILKFGKFMDQWQDYIEPSEELVAKSGLDKWYEKQMRGDYEKA